jgi:hypothetical protein
VDCVWQILALCGALWFPALMLGLFVLLAWDMSRVQFGDTPRRPRVIRLNHSFAIHKIERAKRPIALRR